jgi:hypothetical protein
MLKIFQTVYSSKFFIENLKGKIRRRPSHRWEDNIRMNFREIGWVGVDRIHLAQDRYQWRTPINTLMKNLPVP